MGHDVVMEQEQEQEQDLSLNSEMWDCPLRVCNVLTTFNYFGKCECSLIQS